MVYSNEDAEKIVIIAGPTFGESIKFVLLGAALGAGAMWFLNGKKAPLTAATPNAATDPVQAGLSGGGAKTDADSALARLNSLSTRAKKLATRTQKVVQFAGETVAPAISVAMSEGRRAAREVSEELEQQLQDAKTQSAAKTDDEIVEQV